MNNTSRHSLSFSVTQNSPHLTQLLPPSLRSFKELCLALPVPSGNRHGRRRENPNRIWEASFWLESTIFHRNFSIFQHSRNGFVVVLVGFMIKSQYTGNLTGYNSRPASHQRALAARHPVARFWHLKNCSTGQHGQCSNGFSSNQIHRKSLVFFGQKKMVATVVANQTSPLTPTLYSAYQ